MKKSLTTEQKFEILKKYFDPENQSITMNQLAQEYGCSQSTIAQNMKYVSFDILRETVHDDVDAVAKKYGFDDLTMAAILGHANHLLHG